MGAGSSAKPGAGASEKAPVNGESDKLLPAPRDVREEPVVETPATRAVSSRGSAFQPVSSDRSTPFLSPQMSPQREPSRMSLNSRSKLLDTRPLEAEKAADAAFAHVVAFGTHCFMGAEAAPHLERHSLRHDLLEMDPDWTLHHADAVAEAVSDWAVSRGATMVCHWTQALKSAGASWRCSQPSQVVHAMFSPGRDGRLSKIIDGEYLIYGEGGSRKLIDVTSPIWVRGDTLYVPCVFARYNNSSYAGMDPVIDEKTPLLRAMQAVSRAGVRLLGMFGHSCKSVLPEIGLEQEFFLVTRAAYNRRPDLQQCGRTLIGAPLGNGTNLYDTHSSPLTGTAEACMQAVQNECFKLGIHLRTRHRESAPNQYEYAPFHGVANAQVDENLKIMDLVEEIARRHGLAALLHEKPFHGVNGSGKHNNFSLLTEDGVNLFHEDHAQNIAPDLFPLAMAAMARAVHRHGDLFMASTACPGNDFRITQTGGCEAPPCCMSAHFGEGVTNYLLEYMKSPDGPTAPYEHRYDHIDLGIERSHKIKVSSEPRNRTAPFPYAARRFELRTPGASQNASMVNVILCTAIAESFTAFADEMSARKTAKQVVIDSLKEDGLNAIYNDNCYARSWHVEAKNRGLAFIESTLDRIECLRSRKAVSLFSDLKVFSQEELDERVEVMYENYVITVEIEARCLLDIVQGMVLPVVRRQPGLEAECEALAKSLGEVEAGLADVLGEEEFYDQAKLARELRLKKMVETRDICDALEVRVPSAEWPLSNYRDLLFNDMHAPMTRQ